MTDQIISNSFANKYAKKTAPWGFNGLGYVVYKRTYARPVEGENRTEEWHETIQRCINGAQKIGAKYSKAEAEKLFDLIFNLKCNLAGRMLWQLGTSTVDRFGGNSLLNCWFAKIDDVNSFCFLFENLMLGGGVGFSVRKEDVHNIPKVKKGVRITLKNEKDADFIVPDSREGWISLFRKVMEAYFEKGESFDYSTILVRSAGVKIGGFGGTASGPKILEEGISKICTVIEKREGKKLRSIDCLDICNIIGSVVVAGNIRRSAEIALGDPDDFLFLRAKRWDLGDIPNWRAMSNNTIYIDDYSHVAETVWDGYAGNGEPYGFFNLPLSRKKGRVKDKGNKADLEVCGTNPCGEISLENYECCNLSELYLNNIDSLEELKECSKLLYKTQKAICTLPFIHKETEKVVKKNMRIGQGITGICQVSDEKLDWLDDAYLALKDFDKQWSKENGLNESVKLTTVKPSGTLSLLAGATPGVHPGFSKHFIRRIRMSSSDSLVSQCKILGYNVEYAKGFDGTIDRDMVVVDFPCLFEDGTTFVSDMTAISQLELVKRIQSEWSDNAVSCTVYYYPEELDGIKSWLKANFKDSIKSVSFLLHSGHGFLQAPYEEIDSLLYDKLISKVKPLTQANVQGSEMLDSGECDSGGCPIR
jgi:ribonucleoside-triphosphate reductase